MRDDHSESHSLVHTMTCMEVWGGNRAIKRGISVPGIDAWLSSSPYDGDRCGGRSLDRAIRCDDGCDGDRHQEGPGLLHGQSARVHVRCGGVADARPKVVGRDRETANLIPLRVNGGGRRMRRFERLGANDEKLAV